MTCAGVAARCDRRERTAQAMSGKRQREWRRVVRGRKIGFDLHPYLIECRCESSVDPMTLYILDGENPEVADPVEKAVPETVDLRPPKGENTPAWKSHRVALRRGAREGLDVGLESYVKQGLLHERGRCVREKRQLIQPPRIDGMKALRLRMRWMIAPLVEEAVRRRQRPWSQRLDRLGRQRFPHG